MINVLSIVSEYCYCQYKKNDIHLDGLLRNTIIPILCIVRILIDLIEHGNYESNINNIKFVRGTTKDYLYNIYIVFGTTFAAAVY